MRKSNADEMRFDLLINDLMPPDWSNNKMVTSNYDWLRDSEKHTLKEFEKEIYYSSGNYPKAYT